MSFILDDLERFVFQILVGMLHVFYAWAFLVLKSCKLFSVQDLKLKLLYIVFYHIGYI